MTAPTATRFRKRPAWGIRVERLTGVYQDMERDIVAFVFRCRIADELPTQMNEAYAVRLVDASKSNAQVDVRAHDGAKLLSPTGSVQLLTHSIMERSASIKVNRPLTVIGRHLLRCHPTSMTKPVHRRTSTSPR